MANNAAGGTADVVQGGEPSSSDNASPDSQAFWFGAGELGVLEGVHPDLATYESQRAAPAATRGLVEIARKGVVAAVRAVVEEDYSLMLNRMQVQFGISSFHVLLSCWCFCFMGW